MCVTAKGYKKIWKSKKIRFKKKYRNVYIACRKTERLIVGETIEKVTNNGKTDVKKAKKERETGNKVRKHL